MKPLRPLDKKIGALRQGQGKVGAYVSADQFYALRIAPSCPPDKRVHMRSGRTYLSYNNSWAVWDDWEYRAYTVPELVAELDDPTSVTTEVSFSNANYYQLFILGLKVPATVEEPVASDWSFYLHGTGEELATAGEAEMWINSTEFQQSDPWQHYGGDISNTYPLCGLILRNDGQVGIAGAFLPVDALNRGRSYIWPRDMRPRQPMRT